MYCTYILNIELIIVEISVLEPDPFHFGNPDPDPFHETDPETDPSKQTSPKSWKISIKINQNHKNIIYFLARIFNFCETEILPHK